MNIKDLREKISKKINKQNLRTFFQKQGLYVLIFLCVVAAGITAIIAWPKDTTIEEQVGDSDEDVIMSEDMTLDEELANNIEASPEPTQSDEPEPTEAVQTDGDENTVPASNGSGAIKLTRPLEGQIIGTFSGDELVFFASLNIWATHNGIDIKADEGAQVLAALSGTVEEVCTNEADGGVVVITHADDSETVYAGLGDFSVKKGDKVNAGDVIGTVGEMPTELDLGYHLHFEYIADGAYKDPAKFF